MVEDPSTQYAGTRQRISLPLGPSEAVNRAKRNDVWHRTGARADKWLNGPGEEIHP